jgi:hypothetical protein
MGKAQRYSDSPLFNQVFGSIVEAIFGEGQCTLHSAGHSKMLIPSPLFLNIYFGLPIIVQNYCLSKVKLQP